MSKEGEMTNLSAVEMQVEKVIFRVSWQAGGSADGRASCPAEYFFSKRNTQLCIFIIFVCMNSSGYSLSTSAHVPRNFENGLEYLFNLK